jgi:hypothetical protein
VSLRDVLVAAGVAPGELEHAIADSRRVVRRAAASARVLSSALEQIGTHCKPGSKRQIVALVGSAWLDKFAEQTGGLLRPRGKR